MADSIDFASLADAIFNGAPDGVMVVGIDGAIRLANGRMAELSGVPPDELVGMNVDLLVPAVVRRGHAALRSRFHEAHGTRPMGGGLALDMQLADGTTLPVEVSLASVAVDGEPMVIASVRDVTERRAVERQVRAAADMLMLAGERERIARDLHDTVLQRLFGLGLELQAAAQRADTATLQRIETAVDDIDRIIREIRTAVFTLGSAHRDDSLGHELGVVVSQAARVLGFMPRLRTAGVIEATTTPSARAEIIATLREALSNVARHAHATEVDVELSVTDVLTLEVVDNGAAARQTSASPSGMGLTNLGERARLLGGECHLTSLQPGPGSCLRWWIPLPTIDPA